MNARLLKPLLATAAAFVLAIPAPVEAAPTPLNPGSWQMFFWNGLGPINDPAEGFFLDAVGPTMLRVTDGFITGDAFRVFIDGVLMLTTPMVAKDINTGAVTGKSAWNDARLSKGSIFLGPGQYVITLETYDAPDCCVSGGAFIRADLQQQVVPEPMTMVLLGTGLAGIAVVRRRRRIH